MTGFNHVLTGVTIAVTVQQPLIAPVLALASHFFLDMVPHFGGAAWYEQWGRPLLIMTIVDALLCTLFLALGIAFFPEYWLLIIICAIAATLPDWLWILHYKFGKQHRFFNFHQEIQRYERPWGAYVEISCTILLGLVLFFVFNKQQ